LLAGEYAVLDGADALVIAVDRRAVAHVSDEPQSLSAFLAAARDELRATMGAQHPATLAAARVVVDSAALREGDTKLGLGSSAAATVAAIAAALHHASATAPDADELHQLAFRAHAAAQAPRGSRGSGADIAACVYGGALVVSRADRAEDQPIAVRPIALPTALQLVPVWTGAQADTPSLVAKVRALRDSDPHAYADAIAPIADAARQLIAACRADNAGAAIAAVTAGTAAIAGLGEAAELDLVLDAHRRIDHIAARCGGSAKPTGAGAGDTAVAAFATATDAARFRAEIAASGMIVPELHVDPRGVVVS